MRQKSEEPRRNRGKVHGHGRGPWPPSSPRGPRARPVSRPVLPAVSAAPERTAFRAAATRPRLLPRGCTERPPLASRCSWLLQRERHAQQAHVLKWSRPFALSTDRCHLSFATEIGCRGLWLVKAVEHFSGGLAETRQTGQPSPAEGRQVSEMARPWVPLSSVSHLTRAPSPLRGLHQSFFSPLLGL